MAELDCQGGEAKHLLPALAPCLGKDISKEKEHEKRMMSAAASLEKLVSLWDKAGPVLTAQKFSKSQSLGKGFLDDYHWLNHWSLEKER